MCKLNPSSNMILCLCQDAKQYSKEYTRVEAEALAATMLFQDALQLEFSFNSYSALSYLAPGRKASLLQSGAALQPGRTVTEIRPAQWQQPDPTQQHMLHDRSCSATLMQKRLSLSNSVRCSTMEGR